MKLKKMKASDFRFAIWAVVALTTLTACASLSGESPAFSRQMAVPYLADGQPNQVADMYVPATSGPHPAMLLIHGGGWSRGERADMDKFAKRLANAGYVVMNLGYRFAPEFHFPAQSEDVNAAHQWLEQNAEAWQVDVERVGVMGYSAGGHLALMHGLSDAQDQIQHRVKVVISGAGPTDLTLYKDSPYMIDLVGGVYADFPTEYQRASPLFLVSPDDPAVLMYHGRWDKLVEIGQSRAMAKALTEAKVENQLIEVPFAGHVTNYLFDGGAWPKVLAFIDSKLKLKPIPDSN